MALNLHTNSSTYCNEKYLILIYIYFSLYKKKIVQDNLEKHFSSAQARAIVKRKRVRWGVKDISQGLMIRTISRQHLTYARDQCYKTFLSIIYIISY